MNSTSEETKTGVQPLDADDANLADLSSDEELSGASEGDGPLHQAEEAEIHSTISGDGPEILRVRLNSHRRRAKSQSSSNKALEEREFIFEPQSTYNTSPKHSTGSRCLVFGCYDVTPLNTVSKADS